MQTRNAKFNKNVFHVVVDNVSKLPEVEHLSLFCMSEDIKLCTCFVMHSTTLPCSMQFL
jgi:hypothetical protein